MLREGVEIKGETVQLDGLADPACTRIDGIEHSEVLLCFSNAFMGDDPEELAATRDALAEEMGLKAMVDAVGVASNFQRMVRIADATGIPTDGPGAIMQEDLVELLGTDKYASAGNTNPLPWYQRLFYKLLIIPILKKHIRKASNDG